MDHASHCALPFGDEPCDCGVSVQDLVAHWAEQFRRVLRMNTPPGRDQSLALTKIDEAEMWALRSL